LVQPFFCWLNPPFFVGFPGFQLQDPDPSPAEFRLTLVWSSAFQFFAVPIGSGAKIIAGKGVFRETPEREHDVARVGFDVSLTLGIVALLCTYSVIWE